MPNSTTSQPMSPPGTPLMEPAVLWPEPFLPANASVFAHNEIIIPAPPEQIWPWLLRAEQWPQWYSNADNVHFLSHTGPILRDRSRFRWKTFGTSITSKVLEFTPCSRLAWDAHGIGVEAYHAWVLTPLDERHTHVLTEETQNGWRARLGKMLRPNYITEKHQLWLESLSQKVQSGPPVLGQSAEWTS